MHAAHCDFRAEVGAEESGAEMFELRHYFSGLKRDSLSPAVNGDPPARCVERDDDFLARDIFRKLLQKDRIHSSTLENGASDNNLVRAPVGNFLSARDGSNAPADANFYSKILARLSDKVSNEIVIHAFSHGGIQVNHV